MNARCWALPGHWLVPLLLLLASGCAGPQPRWRDDMLPAFQEARAGGREVVVFFALAGRDASDRMRSQLADEVVLAALADGDFVAVVADAVAHKRLYAEWIGGGEGMGIAVLDAGGQCYAARPGPQDPPELAAFLRLCAASRDELASRRAAATGPGAGPLDQHRLGVLLLQLGCRKQCEPLLLDAAMAGVADARHRLARLYALDGNLTPAKRWLDASAMTPAAQVTLGYVRFKERRHEEAVAAFEQALQAGGLGEDRQRALLYLGKALHEARRDDEARRVLDGLIAEGTGSTFEAAAVHTLGHMQANAHGHSH